VFGSSFEPKTTKNSRGNELKIELYQKNHILNHGYIKALNILILYKIFYMIHNEETIYYNR
jgi:hypothetical protein